MGGVMLWLALAWLLERCSFVMTAHNYGALWNGLGAVESVLDRKADAPMAYRVLVPWLMAPARRLNLPMLETYEVLKVLCLAFGLWGTAQGFGLSVALLVAAMLPATFFYDYWDFGVELGALGLAMSGRFDLALVGVGLYALSRETWPLAPGAFYLATGDVTLALWLAAAGLAAWLVVRGWAGDRVLYCERWMVRQNWKDLVGVSKERPAALAAMVVSLAVCGLGLAAAVLGAPGGWTVLPLVLAGWTLGRANETRVFSGVLPWVAWVLLRGV